jgi:DNA polymerase (family 10)
VDNEAIARTFLELADVLELLGEVPFKVRAFRTAARAIEGMGEPIEQKIKDDSLGKVNGIGDGVVRRIKELVETGKLADLDDHKKKLPPGLMDLMNLPGIGIKTAQQVWKERKVTTIDQLEAAAKDGKLRDLPRFGAKREEKLLVSIAAWRKRASAPKRWPMAEALELAQALTAHMRAVPGVLQCDFAGSLRRRRETVGDIDVLVAAEPEHAHGIMDAFATMPEVAEILARGETKTTVIMKNGIQSDLRVVPRASFGAALQYFTGSKEHNVAMRTIAVKRGLKVSEYGVFKVAPSEPGREQAPSERGHNPKDESVAGETEEDVYEAIGLRWMPPEMRENRGEIDAAKNGTLPKLVELPDLIGDLHMHTTETDGRASIEDMARAALALGRKYIAITDHSQSLTIANGVTLDRLRAHVKRIREVDEKLDGSIRLLAGIETDILGDGSLDLEGELDSLDWVIGSVHSKLGMPREEITKRVVRAIESGHIDALGHPFGRMLGSRDGSDLDIEVILKALAKTGVAIELNASPLRLDVPENGARMARELGVPVAIDSDAHSTRELGFLKYGIGIARRAWLGAEHVLTTKPFEAIRAHRAARLSS